MKCEKSIESRDSWQSADSALSLAIDLVSAEYGGVDCVVLGAFACPSVPAAGAITVVAGVQAEMLLHYDPRFSTYVHA